MVSLITSRQRAAVGGLDLRRAADAAPAAEWQVGDERAHFRRRQLRGGIPLAGMPVRMVLV